MSQTGSGRILNVLMTRFGIPAIVVAVFVVGVGWAMNPARRVAEGKLQRQPDLLGRDNGNRTASLFAIRQSLQSNLGGRTAIRQVIKDLHLIEDLPHHPDGTLTDEGQKAISPAVRRALLRPPILLTMRYAGMAVTAPIQALHSSPCSTAGPMSL